MLTHISLNAIVSDDNYQFTLMATDENNVSKNIKMPIDLNSPEGLLITNLINQAWDYIPDAEPDELSQAKARKLQAINNEWISLEKTGWDSGQGYYLGITPSDVALLVGVFSLAKEAAALGLELPHLISMANTPISFSTIQEMTLLLLQYGQARSNMASSFAARRKAVADAITIEELGVI
jgi:hypothetical protein